MNWCPLYPTGSSPPLFTSLPPSQSSPLLPTPSPSSLLFFPLSSCPLPFPLAPPLSQSALSQSEWRVIREQGEGWAKDFEVFWSSTSLLSNVYNPPLYVENDWPPPNSYYSLVRGCEKQNSSIEGLKQTKKLKKKKRCKFCFSLAFYFLTRLRSSRASFKGVPHYSWQFAPPSCPWRFSALLSRLGTSQFFEFFSLTIRKARAIYYLVSFTLRAFVTLSINWNTW